MKAPARMGWGPQRNAAAPKPKPLRRLECSPASKVLALLSLGGRHERIRESAQYSLGPKSSDRLRTLPPDVARALRHPGAVQAEGAHAALAALAWGSRGRRKPEARRATQAANREPMVRRARGGDQMGNRERSRSPGRPAQRQPAPRSGGALDREVACSIRRIQRGLGARRGPVDAGRPESAAHRLACRRKWRRRREAAETRCAQLSASKVGGNHDVSDSGHNKQGADAAPPY